MSAPARGPTPLATALALDVLFDVVPNRWLHEERRRLRLPGWTKAAIPAAKASSAIGLFAGRRRPALGRRTSEALVVYFVLAVTAHVRVHDHPVRAVPAAAMLLWSASVRSSFQKSATSAA